MIFSKVSQEDGQYSYSFSDSPITQAEGEIISKREFLIGNNLPTSLGEQAKTSEDFLQAMRNHYIDLESEALEGNES